MGTAWQWHGYGTAKRGGETNLEEQHGRGNGDCKESRGYQVGQRVWEALKECDATKDVGILPGRLGKETSEGGTDDGAQRPDQGHDGKGPGLKFFLRDHFGDHGSYYAD